MQHGSLPELNEEQKRAVFAPSKLHLLIVAGAGTGKTTTLLSRARFLIQEQGVHPSKVAILTYTKAAAKEARERLKRYGICGIRCDNARFCSTCVTAPFHHMARFQVAPYHRQ